jgi:hypothetical protein
VFKYGRYMRSTAPIREGFANVHVKIMHKPREAQLI